MMMRLPGVYTINDMQSIDLVREDPPVAVPAIQVIKTLLPIVPGEHVLRHLPDAVQVLHRPLCDHSVVGVLRGLAHRMDLGFGCPEG